MPGAELIKPSQHGLGHLLNPADPEDESRDWITEAWTWVLTPTGPVPDWFARPAVGRLTVTSPTIHKLLGPLNHDRAYRDQIKPFNFLLIAFVHPLERPANDQRVALIAPYTNDPAAWTTQPWINRYSGRTYRITTEPSHSVERDGLVSVRTYEDILWDYAKRPEHKSNGPDGARCGKKSLGLLSRRWVAGRTITHIGKESNQLEVVQAGLAREHAEVLNAYDEARWLNFCAEVLPILRSLGPREVARRTGLAPASVHAALSGKSRPRQASLARYESVAAGLGSSLRTANDRTRHQRVLELRPRGR